ncbi:hypothetical protein Btru_040693 [Bulinus truncatus]|nr:hypothetical protein Btru_040693 [Bulinus truncatus]
MDSSRSRGNLSLVKFNGHTDKEKLARSDSNLAKLCDLHVYKVPTELWRENFNNILNNVVTETVSVGIIRVPLELRLADVREEIIGQLQLDELLPRDYVFLRSVGRSLTRLRHKQEFQLKAKHFVPPVAYAPELYILETTPEMRDAMAISDRSSQSPPMSRKTSPSHRGYNATYRKDYPGDSDNERSNKNQHKASSPVNRYQPLPKISPDKNNRDKDQNLSPDPKSYDSDDSPYRKHNGHHHPYRNHNGNSQIYHEQPGSEWDDQPGEKRTTDFHRAGHLTPGHSHNTKRGPVDLDDSDVADDEDFKRVNRDDHENRFRKKQDLQKMLDEDKYLLDDETEEERRRRLEDIDFALEDDKQRWHANQEERRRQALSDRRREEEEKHLRELENRKREEFERKKLEENERKRKEEERRLRDEEERRRKKEQEEEENRMYEEEEQRRREEAVRRRKEEEKRRKEEEEKQRKEEERENEEEKLRREEEERHQREEKRKEEEKQRREEERRIAEERRREEEKIKEAKRQEEQQKKEQERREELKRRQDQEEWERKLREEHARQEAEKQKSEEINSSPPVRDTESAKQRRRNEKNQLLKDIEEARQARQDQEKEREELVKKAKQMQHKTTNRRNEARDMWKKKYFEEKKKTAPLEENSNRLQQELEALHKKLMNTLEGPKERNPKLIDAQPSLKSNYIIQCTKLQHEIEDFKRRVENAKMKLTAEMKLRSQAQVDLKAVRAEAVQNRLAMKLARGSQDAEKLRNQAEGELRALRAELNQKKLSMERNRQQQMIALNPALIDMSLKATGLRETDPRLKECMQNLNSRQSEISDRDAVQNIFIDKETFRECITENIILIAKAFRNQFIIPEFEQFTQRIDELFWRAKANTHGQLASWGLAICTVDGQRYALGDAYDPVCLQSVSKPLTYAMVLDELGPDVVHQYVGQEPSGQAFNTIGLDPKSDFLKSFTD